MNLRVKETVTVIPYDDWIRVQESSRGMVKKEIMREAFLEYQRRFGNDQSIERIAERGGFGWSELVEFLYSRLMTARGEDP